MPSRHRFATATATATALIACAAAITPASAAAPEASRTQNEQTSIRLVSTSLRVGEGRRVAVRVRCSTRAACTGTLRLRVGNGSDRHPKRYRVAGRRTATILVGITPTAKRKIEGTKTLATVTLTESGPNGERSLERRLPIRL